MNKLEKEFIPYEQALALKELGFDDYCLTSYLNGNLQTGISEIFWFQHSYRSHKKQEFVSAPTFSQAFRWFRERWGYDIHVRGTNFRASYVIGIPKEINMESGDGYPLVIDWDYIVDGTGVRKTYEEAELACLRKLIEIIKTKQNG